MKLTNILLATTLLTGSLYASEFVGYKQITKKLKSAHTKAGTFATSEDVKKALKSKDWLILDVRTEKEWAAARIAGAKRVGRQASEKQCATYALDDDDKFVKDKVILVCNSGSRASIEAETFKQMGFAKVKIFDIYSWIDECNPIVNDYSKKKDKKGTKQKFGAFYAEHCKK